MKFELISAVPGAPAKRRIVLIPGAYQRPEDFHTAGFPAAVRERGLEIDIVLVAPPQEHVTDRSALERLHAEVVLPAQSSGRIAVWLAGISWGGFLALLYGADHPEALDGICLLSPYLGSRLMSAEISRYGSLARWNALAADAPDELAEDRRVWRYIANQVPHPPPVHYLGFGRQDRFAAAQQLLAGQLPATAVDTVDGGHDWPVWRRLWDHFLDRLATSSEQPLSRQ